MELAEVQYYFSSGKLTSSLDLENPALGNFSFDLLSKCYSWALSDGQPLLWPYTNPPVCLGLQ